jgi:polyisoprenyl-phosphate glycosyltransferase
MGELGRPQIEFIIPAYNEGEGIRQTYDRLKIVLEASGLNGTILFVDDGSRDNTWEVLTQIAQTEPRVRLLRFSRNFGHQPAITAGLAHSNADYNLILDADLQDPPELLGQMMTLAQQGYQVVYAVRSAREGETPAKKATANLFYKVINWFSPFAIPLDAGDFRLVSAQARQLFLQAGDKGRLNREIWSWIGLKQIGIPYLRPGRAFGKSKYNWKRMLRLAFDGLTATGTGPLLALAAAAGGLFFLSLLLVLFRQTLPAGMALTSGVVLAGMAIVGLYVGRLYHQARHRPTYLIAEIISKNPSE